MFFCRDPDVSGNWIFAGVVSFGDGCAEPGKPGGYVRVAHYLEWISKIMSNYIFVKNINPKNPIHLIFLIQDDTSETLPMFPKTECPGITCQRGLGKCLSQGNVCDCVVDCFGAEDEMDCPRDKCPKTEESVI